MAESRNSACTVCRHLRGSRIHASRYSRTKRRARALQAYGKHHEQCDESTLNGIHHSPAAAHGTNNHCVDPCRPVRQWCQMDFLSRESTAPCSGCGASIAIWCIQWLTFSTAAFACAPLPTPR